MTTVCLTMIVKNEAHVLARCIATVRHLVDYWIIVDTGSTDETEAVARAALEGVPGEFHRAEWEGFGKARTRSLELAAGKADYAFVVDADELWSGSLDKGALTADCYSLWVIHPDMRWLTTRLFRLAKGWRYEGVVHEHPVTDGEWTGLALDTLTVTSPSDGARSQDPEKYRKDAVAIGEALVADPTNTRLVFYLAQSWRDYGDDERAARHYLQRAAMGPGPNWEEVYVSYLEAGRALLRQRKLDEGKAALLKAHETYPGRREAMAELCRVFAVLAATSPTVGALFVENHPVPGLEEEAA